MRGPTRVAKDFYEHYSCSDIYFHFEVIINCLIAIKLYLKKLFGSIITTEKLYVSVYLYNNNDLFLKYPLYK